MLVQQVDAQLVRPPGAALGAAACSVVDRAFARAGALFISFFVHDSLRWCSVIFFVMIHIELL